MTARTAAPADIGSGRPTHPPAPIKEHDMTDPAAASCTDLCIACMTDESHDPAPTTAPTPTKAATPSAPADRAAEVLRHTETYLSALHGSVARHDNLAADYGCAGCELRDQVAAELCRMAGEAQQAGARAACGTPSPDGDYTCQLPTGHDDYHADKPLEEITPNGSRMIWETPIVARRNPDGGPLHCARCGFGDDELEPLTADDLPDGGICADCGVDVLIPQAGKAGRG